MLIKRTILAIQPFNDRLTTPSTFLTTLSTLDFQLENWQKAGPLPPRSVAKRKTRSLKGGMPS